MSIKIVNRGTSAFASIGTAVTNGCEFLMSGINWSTTTGTIWQDFVASSKINPNSTFANWVFPSSSVSINRMFRGSTISGVNSTLNISGWSTFSGSGFYQAFQNFNSADSPDTDQGIKINISNINLSNVNSFSSMFEGSDVSEIIGLSTLGACAGNANLSKFMFSASFLKLSSSGNFSNTFIASLNPIATGISDAFKYCGGGLSSNFGVAPNLTNIDLSNVTGVNSTFEGARFYDAPDLSTATFPSTGVQFSKTFKAMRTENSNSHVDFSNVSVKISYAREMFNNTYVDNVTFGNNVDFSPCTDVYRKFYYSSSKSGTINITYPTVESGLSWAALNEPLDWFKGTTGPTTGPLTTCQVDNLIRSFHNTALNSGLTVDFYQSQITEAPSIVRAQQDELVANGWTFYDNTTDATMPFVYTGSFLINTDITPTINTSGGTFFSSDVTVNEATGTFNTSTAGNVTIRYTITATGCYNEQVLSVVPPFTPFKFRVTGPISIKAQPAVAGQNFTIDWGDGSTPVSTPGGASIPSNFTTAGTYDVQINALGDNTYCDEFAIVSGQTNVTQVLDWGEKPWNNLGNAFQNCSNLTSLSNTTLTTASTCNFSYAFNLCTSLQSVDLRNWDLSQGVNLSHAFYKTYNIEEIDATNSNVNINIASTSIFSQVGTQVTNGCLFKMSGFNLSNSTANSPAISMFNNSRIKKDSTFANWVFPSTMGTNISFRLVVLPMQDTTLDCSGWTTYSSTSLPDFQQVNYSYNGYAQPPTSSTGLKIDITNLNVSNVTNIAQKFYYSFQDEVVGLSTLGATNGATSMSIMFAYNKFMKFTAANNFSNAFMSSLNLNTSTSLNQTFRGQGNSVPDADASLAPNFSGLDLSNIDDLTQTFYSTKYSNALDFTNVTMNASTSYAFNNAFRSCRFLDGGNVNSLFSKTFKVSSLNQAFRDCRMGSIIFGSNIDLSPNDSFFLTFYEFGLDIASPTIEFADNVSFANVQNWDRPFYNVGTTNTPLSTCQVDNFIRRLQATRPTAGAITNKTIDFQNSAVTESPSVVRGLADTLVNTGGYILDLYSTDATIPFEYTGDLEPDTTITPTNNTGSAFTGTFSSSNSNIPVVATGPNAGLINTPNGGNTTIRYTLANGCYTEQAIVINFPYKIEVVIPSNDLTFPIYGSSSNGALYDYTVDWGDGTSNSYSGSAGRSISRTYGSAGTYQISIKGNAWPGATWSATQNKLNRITKLLSWGNTGLSDLANAFNGSTALVQATPPDTIKWNANATASLYRCFYNCVNLTNASLAGADTSVKNGVYAREVFANCSSLETLNVQNLVLDNDVSGNCMYRFAAATGTSVTDGTEINVSNFTFVNSTS